VTSHHSKNRRPFITRTCLPFSMRHVMQMQLCSSAARPLPMETFSAHSYGMTTSPPPPSTSSPSNRPRPHGQSASSATKTNSFSHSARSPRRRVLSQQMMACQIRQGRRLRDSSHINQNPPHPTYFSTASAQSSACPLAPSTNPPPASSPPPPAPPPAAPSRAPSRINLASRLLTQ
jgi:hypothetical protein